MNSVSIENIAKEIGISKGAVFFHFSTKDELAFETMKWFIEKKLIRDLAGDTDQPRRELIRNLVLDSITMSLEYPRYPNFLFQMLSGKKAAQIMELVDQIFAPYNNLITKELEGLNIPNPEQNTFMLLALLDGLGIHLALQNQLKQISISEEYINALTDGVMQLFFG